MQRKRVIKSAEGFFAATGREPDEDLAHAVCEDDETGYCLSASRFPNSPELLEVMVYDQIALQTGDVTVELAPNEFRLTLSEEAAAQLDGTVEYVVPLSGTSADLERLDEVLGIIFDGKHGGRYMRKF